MKKLILSTFAVLTFIAIIAEAKANITEAAKTEAIRKCRQVPANTFEYCSFENGWKKYQ